MLNSVHAPSLGDVELDGQKRQVNFEWVARYNENQGIIYVDL